MLFKCFTQGYLVLVIRLIVISHVYQCLGDQLCTTISQDQSWLVRLISAMVTRVNSMTWKHWVYVYHYRTNYCICSIEFIYWPISLLSIGPSSNRRATVVPEEVSDEGVFRRFVRLLLAFIVKVFAFFHIVRSQQETRVNNLLPPAEPELISDDHPAVETFNVDHISPVIERLQRLEGKVDELGSKPPAIPVEKERSLLESWDRIKCIESDLERTKKVSFHQVCQFISICTWWFH